MVPLRPSFRVTEEPRKAFFICLRMTTQMDGSSFVYICSVILAIAVNGVWRTKPSRSVVMLSYISAIAMMRAYS